MAMTLREATEWAQDAAAMTPQEAATWATGYVARRSPGQRQVRRTGAGPARLTDAQFATLLDRVVPAPAVVEAQSPTDLADLVAAFDPTSASVLRKVDAGVPIHKLDATENEQVRLAWIRDQHGGYFSRGTGRS